jgi:hypothetical protein
MVRLAGVCTSKRRVLRLMREHGLLAPGRQPQPADPKRHDGTILAERPNQMWGIDATAGFTAQDGQVAIFAMVGHDSAYCLGIHAAKRGTRLEALEPVRQAVQEQFGGFGEAIAAGVRLRHDHGSQFMSVDLQADIHSVENHHRLARGHAVWRYRVPARIFMTSGGPMSHCELSPAFPSRLRSATSAFKRRFSSSSEAQPLRLIHVQAAGLGASVIQRLAVDRQLSRQILRRTPSFELLDGVHHLFFGELGFPHPESSFLSSLRSFRNYLW